MILHDRIKGNCKHPLFSTTFYHHCGSFATVILRVHPTSKQPSPWLDSTLLQRSFHHRPATYRKRNWEMPPPGSMAFSWENPLKFSHGGSDHFVMSACWHYLTYSWVVWALLQENPMSRCSPRRGCSLQKAARASKLPTVWTEVHT